MHKTTVYLEESQVERLGRLAGAVGRSQAELIREGVERLLEEAPPRTFHSMGKGRGGGAGAPRGWDGEGLHAKVRGERHR
jgi:Arc/MetJ-type ribon-helix-helix transcriptional regulator